MIIKEIKINNFRSYYGSNHLSLSKGLTLVIGDNGDGKTTLYEALEWLFETTGENRIDSHISEKRKSELEIGESDEVSVSITFEHDGEKEIEKSFTFERLSEDNVRTKDYKFVGYFIEGSERYSIAGDRLLNMCFETVIRNYCMFKGEDKLNVFGKDDTALKVLVNTFSGIRDFDRLVELTSNFEQSSARAANRELQNDKKVSNQAKELNTQLNDVTNDIQSIKTELNQKKVSISEFASKLELLEKNQETSERYQAIKERIKGLKDKRAKLVAWSSCEYSTNLLDEYWILRSFPAIIKEFSAKVSALSKEKRRLDKQETERRAKEAGEREAISKIQKLANDAVPLPWNLPDEATMKEMIDDEICKVCGRPAPKGSEAYEFMCNKLNEYLSHIAAEVNKNSSKGVDEKPLFPNSFINELHSRQIKLSGDTEQEISKIATTISDRLEFVTKRKAELAEVDKQLQELETEQNDLLMQSGLSAELLDKSISDLRGFFDAKSRAESRVSELETTLNFKENAKAEIQEKLSQLEPTSSMTQVYQRVHTAFEKITKAFANAKEQNINNFLQMLETESNKYLQKLNKNDFYGIIRIRKTINNSARIELYSDNGTRIENPNGALKTTMYMSVLFAISQITTLKREQDYPLIFDAPTSSFGGFKEDTFYNVIDTIDKQCVIVTKDLLNIDKATGQKALDFDTINKLSCSVYRIEKVEPFNDKDLSTIQTIVKQVR
ncbi:MAG: AAA family ATPase [Paludibacteraceae bacterium]|nr:AAA family ATPase [Paludibacteraceae bacterium]